MTVYRARRWVGEASCVDVATITTEMVFGWQLCVWGGYGECGGLEMQVLIGIQPVR